MPLTILVVDDSAEVRAVLREALTADGYRVLEAADGCEGVRLYRECRPALVLVDIVMPEKDGVETVREILAIDRTAVVFTFSGKEGARDRNRVARRFGATRGFVKPFAIFELLGAMREEILARRPPLVAKSYLEGFQVSVHKDGILIQAVDYHTQPLYLDEEALTELGLSLRGDDEPA